MRTQLQITAIGTASRGPAKGYTTTKVIESKISTRSKKSENGRGGVWGQKLTYVVAVDMVFEEDSKILKKNRFFDTFFDQFNI